MSAEQLSNLAEGRSVLETVVTSADADVIGAELLNAADLISGNSGLLRAFTDQSRSSADRGRLAEKVFAQHCTEAALSVVRTIVVQHWSNPKAFLDALEELGVAAYLLGARQRAELRLVQSELFAVTQLLSDSRDLRIQLSELGRGTAGARAALMGKILGDSVQPTTRALVQRAVERSHHGRLLQTLREYEKQAAELGGTQLVTVATARDLTGSQRERMKNLVERQLGHPVTLAVAVDPDLVGGFRINYGEEAVDSSIRSDIAKAKRALTRPETR